MTVAAVRETSTSVSTPMDNAMAPINEMGKTRQLSGPQDRIVPTVNNDTMYSQAHYDLDLAGPMVIDIPPTGERYYIVQLLDAYSDSITDLYAGNTGTEGSKVLLVNHDWQGEVPEGIDHVVRSRTPMVWLIHRTGVFGPKDQKAAIAVHDRFISYPLKELGQKHGPVELTKADGRIPPMTRPKGLDWFALIDRELRKNPLPEALSMVDQFEYIGIGGDEPFDENKLSQAQKRGLMRALKSGQSIIQYAGRSVGTTNNGWSMMFEGGQYGNDYLSRASINLRAAGLNVPERALYPNRYTDSKGKQLNGGNQYRMTMPADAPAEAFWSLTMYDADNLFMVENEIDRYSISTNRKEELKYAPDGTLPICIQHTKPADEQCNWLPAPEDDFYLHIRLYEPTAAVLNNEYQMPQVHKL
ncbi:phosphatidylserine decarboxylase [Vibrio sp. JCM 19236]|nr:phosphatidylserine decarboxylase [Vibrio sp. JCM 19236]